MPETIMSEGAIEKLAEKLVVAEIRHAETNTGIQRSIADGAADAVADTIITVVDLGITPWGLREVVRSLIAAAQPRPSVSAGAAYRRWHLALRDQMVAVLEGRRIS